MPNVFAGGFSALKGAYQSLTGATPLVTLGAQAIQCIPGEKGIDPMFVSGGIADAATITVQTLRSDWGTLPVKQDVLTLTAHPSAPDGTYQVLDVTHKEGTLLLNLGNLDAQ